MIPAVQNSVEKEILGTWQDLDENNGGTIIFREDQSMDIIFSIDDDDDEPFILSSKYQIEGETLVVIFKDTINNYQIKELSDTTLILEFNGHLSKFKKLYTS